MAFNDEAPRLAYCWVSRPKKTKGIASSKKTSHIDFCSLALSSKENGMELALRTSTNRHVRFDPLFLKEDEQRQLEKKVRAPFVSLFSSRALFSASSFSFAALRVER